MFSRFILAVLFIGLSTSLQAAFPGKVTYQGALKENGVPLTGTAQIEISFTNEDGSVVYWTGAPQTVSIVEGLYKVELSPDGVDWESIDPYIQTKVNGTLLLPREKLNSTPYALVARDLAGAAEAKGDLTVQGQLKVENETPGIVNTLLKAGSNVSTVNGSKQLLLQQLEFSDGRTDTHLIGSGYISGDTEGYVMHSGQHPYTALTFNPWYFGLMWENNGAPKPGVVVDAENGFVGIGTTDAHKQLTVEGDTQLDGDVQIKGALQNDDGKPAIITAIVADYCGGGHPYYGCPDDYIEVGRHRVRFSCSDHDLFATAYNNGSIRDGWIATCVIK